MPSIETKSGKARRKKRQVKTSVTVETKSEEDFFEGLDVGDAEPEKIEKENESAASNPMTMRCLWLQKSSMYTLSLSVSIYVSPCVFAQCTRVYINIFFIIYKYRFIYIYTYIYQYRKSMMPFYL